MKIGDKISFINENLKGKILKINKKELLILDEFGFERSISPEEVVPLDTKLYEDISIIKKKEPAPKRSLKNKQKIMTLDLHFENLVENPKKYNSWERLFIQKEKLQEMLEFCRKNKIKQLEIIHGLGDGVVQEMVLEVLKGEINIEYENQNLFKNQSGSIQVYF